MRKLLPVIIIYVLTSWPIFSQERFKVEDALIMMSNGYITESIQMLEKLTNLNEVYASLFLGQCYVKGYGVALDKHMAFKLFRRAAEKGLPEAQVLIAQCYASGIGCQVDKDKSQYWRDKSEGRSNAQILEMVEVSYKEGIKAQKILASKGNRESDTSLNTHKRKEDNIPYSPVPSSNDHLGKSNDMPKTAHILSDVDMGIPQNPLLSDSTFAVIICNQNYIDVPCVEFALNDGMTVAKYFNNTLGIDSIMIHVVKDGTYNQIKREINWIKRVSENSPGMHLIFYYAGHGYPDDKSREAYLVPTDADINDLSTCFSLASIYDEFSKLPLSSCVAFIDACFSGANRGEGAVIASRGLSLKPKGLEDHIGGNLFVFTAASDDQSAYPYKDKAHGLFTYFLLKEIQRTSGKINLEELTHNVSENVKKYSLILNNKKQTPWRYTSKTFNLWKEHTLYP